MTQTQFMTSVGVTTWQHAFTRIPYFDIITMLPRDLMHVELEGNLKVHAYGLLYLAIKKYKWFTRAELNAAILSFPFLRDRPPDITKPALKGRKGTLPRKKGTVTMTSGQMLQFVIHSLEIMRPIMPAAALLSPEYAAWVAHVKYFSALMANTFTESSIQALDDLIHDAQEQFLAIAHYSELWKPKNHFAQHFPADIRLFGPPCTYWCMRFEAKNQEHKRSAKMGDFKDVARSVSRFWTIRSGLRLLGKRKHVQLDDITSCKHHNGLELNAGSWMLAQPAGGQTILCCIQAVHNNTIIQTGCGVWL